MDQCYRIYNRIRASALTALLSSIVLLCVVQIILRYFTSASIKPFAWGDEIVRLSSIWVSFLAASVGVRDSAHLSVEFFVEKLIPVKAQPLFKRAITVVTMLTLVLLVWFGVSRTIANIPTMLQNLPISMGIFYAAIPIGCLCMIFDYSLILIHGKHPYAGGMDKPAEKEDEHA